MPDKLLQFFELTGVLSDELKLHLSSILKSRKVAKREFLLKAGHICRTIGFVDKGLLRCFYKKGDIEICSSFMKEGDIIISIESFFQQKESYESIQVLEDCHLFYMDYNELQEVYRRFPEFNKIGRILVERYYTLWAQQLYGLRMQTAIERYQWLLDYFPELLLRVQSKYLASYLGMTEVTLSRIKSR